MSYYSNPFKFAITNHAIKRAKQRLNLSDYSTQSIHLKLEEIIENSVLDDSSSDYVYKNLQFNITIVVDYKLKIIKTVY